MSHQWHASDIQVGDVVMVSKRRRMLLAIVRYIGPRESEDIMFGVEVHDGPLAADACDGSYNGKTYFNPIKPNSGLFVKSVVRKISPEELLMKVTGLYDGYRRLRDNDNDNTVPDKELERRKGQKYQAIDENPSTEYPDHCPYVWAIDAKTGEKGWAPSNFLELSLSTPTAVAKNDYRPIKELELKKGQQYQVLHADRVLHIEPSKCVRTNGGPLHATPAGIYSELNSMVVDESPKEVMSKLETILRGFGHDIDFTVDAAYFVIDGTGFVDVDFPFSSTATRVAVFFKISIWYEDDDRTRFECRRQTGDPFGFSEFWTQLEDQSYRTFTNARGARSDWDDEFGDDAAMAPAQHQRTESAQLRDIESTFKSKVEEIKPAQREHAAQSVAHNPASLASISVGSYKWSLSQPVAIWSQSASRWCPGEVTHITQDDDGYCLDVRYWATPQRPKAKYLAASSENLRPLHTPYSLRSDWRTGSKVECFSNSQKRWYKATVVEVIRHAEDKEDWLKIQWSLDLSPSIANSAVSSAADSPQMHCPASSPQIMHKQVPRSSIWIRHRYPLMQNIDEFANSDDTETNLHNASRSQSSRESRHLDDDDLQYRLKQQGNDEKSAGDVSADSDFNEIDQHPHQKLSHAELLEIEAGMNIMADIQEKDRLSAEVAFLEEKERLSAEVARLKVEAQQSAERAERVEQEKRSLMDSMSETKMKADQIEQHVEFKYKGEMQRLLTELSKMATQRVTMEDEFGARRKAEQERADKYRAKYESVKQHVKTLEMNMTEYMRVNGQLRQQNNQFRTMITQLQNHLRAMSGGPQMGGQGLQMGGMNGMGGG